jgi:hypothetical protein
VVPPFVLKEEQGAQHDSSIILSSNASTGVTAETSKDGATSSIASGWLMSQTGDHASFVSNNSILQQLSADDSYVFTNDDNDFNTDIQMLRQLGLTSSSSSCNDDDAHDDDGIRIYFPPNSFPINDPSNITTAMPALSSSSAASISDFSRSVFSAIYKNFVQLPSVDAIVPCSNNNNNNRDNEQGDDEENNNNNNEWTSNGRIMTISCTNSSSRSLPVQQSEFQRTATDASI